MWSDFAVSRRGPGFSADVSELGKVQFSGGPECRPLVDFHSGGARRDPACPRHAQKPPGTGQIITECRQSRSVPTSFLFHYISPANTPTKTRNQLPVSENVVF